MAVTVLRMQFTDFSKMQKIEKQEGTKEYGTHIYCISGHTRFFASLIRHYLGQKYVHVVLSLDEQLSEAYSFGRRNPYIR